MAECGHGFYDDKGRCKRCMFKCLTCLGKPDVCSGCVPPYFLEFTDCVRECPIGKFGNTKTRKCELCDKQCQTCYNGEKNYQCKSCPEGLYLSELLARNNLYINVASLPSSVESLSTLASPLGESKLPGKSIKLRVGYLRFSGIFHPPSCKLRTSLGPILTLLTPLSDC